MAEDNAFQGGFENHRKFFRSKLNTPLHFRSFIPRANQRAFTEIRSEGISQNVSSGGILFQTKSRPPKVASLVWLNVDLKNLKVGPDIEKRVLTHQNGVLGRIVRVTEKGRAGQSFDVGVSFLTLADKDTSEVQNILTHIDG